MADWYGWAAFVALVAVVLSVDLGLFQRRAHDVSFKQAAAWTATWVALALAFAAVMWWWRGGHVAAQFLAGYLIEWSLSVDNVFVFVLIFTHFAVPSAYQHRVLFWGVLGAIALRLLFILGGAALLDAFHWIIYVFGALLLITAYRFVREKEAEPSVEENVVLRALRRFVPMTDSFQGQRFFIRRPDGRRVATPLFAVLVMVEAADVVFAIDSIPAIFAITRDTFVVFASNVLAILGLRSLYFVLAGAVTRFRYLRPSLAVLLAFIGVKMLISSIVAIPIWLSLTAIVVILGSGVLASVMWTRRQTGQVEGRTG